MLGSEPTPASQRALALRAKLNVLVRMARTLRGMTNRTDDMDDAILRRQLRYTIINIDGAIHDLTVAIERIGEL